MERDRHKECPSNVKGKHWVAKAMPALAASITPRALAKPVAMPWILAIISLHVPKH